MFSTAYTSRGQTANNNSSSAYLTKNQQSDKRDGDVWEIYDATQPHNGAENGRLIKPSYLYKY